MLHGVLLPCCAAELPKLGVHELSTPSLAQRVALRVIQHIDSHDRTLAQGSVR